ncbi:hypothetical protein GWN63_00870 [Candidatus Bathyarchaeota archaeon]|nr:glycosyltransferase family 2 protein [Candidatus Bathyarchaeota archaeon]NIU80789.1 hypothetical protein [Candidatus Bathyarchaeota archaeon]NIV67414.1 hypothetical protein [Candidatus Bathyarchaeota archaeon]NIW15958.1 hypothetical protein [Candidatus Bathyarchaeota archaeon]NIW34060.1 hypothetical protein [Candidatus Bathyarchaeota archaeon]
MSTILVIPTYWTVASSQLNAPSLEGGQVAVYDHPTCLDDTGSLPRLLRNLEALKRKGTDVPKVIVLVAVTHKGLEEEADKKTQSIVRTHSRRLNITSFSALDLEFLVSQLKMRSFSELADLLSLVGYSNVRNVGLAIGQILESEAIIFLDDDEMITDEDFFEKCTQFVGEKHEEKIIGGVTGYYVNPWGSYWLKEDPREWWKTGWWKRRKMNEAFRIIERENRLKDTPFALGGNMVLHKELFEKIPFDPYIPRGEDIDMLVNAKMFDLAFLLDSKLWIVHSPEKVASRWSEMRQDLYRFVYMRKKLSYQKNVEGVNYLPIESLNPYPGYFLRRGLRFKFTVSSFLSAAHSAFKSSNIRECMEYLQNLKLALSDVPSYAKKHYKDYFGFQEQWAKTMPLIRGEQPVKEFLEEKKGLRE